MKSKLYVQQMLNKLSLLQLRQLAGEFKLDSRGSKSQLINRLINPMQIGGADSIGLVGPAGPLGGYSIVGGQLEAFLLNYVDTFTGEVDIPIEQFKKVLNEVGIKYDYSPKEWFKILLPSKILSKVEPPFKVLPMFVNTLNILPELSYGELKILNSYYPGTINISQQTLEAKKQSDLLDLQKWLASYRTNYSIGALSNLNNLNLRGDPIKSLPDSIGALSNLEWLVLIGTPLQSLPNSIGNLSKLKSLELAGTQLRSLPDSIWALSNLERLDLDGTQLKSLPDSIGNLSNLKRLDLDGTQLKSLPDSIWNLSNLESLNLRNTPLQSLPNSIGNLSNLKVLALSGTPLRSLPDSIGNLSNLRYLWLSGTQLTSLPESIGNLSKLESLDLRVTDGYGEGGGVGLLSLPNSIGNLSNLESLDLTGTRLQSLPDSIGDLYNLKWLYLSETLLSLPVVQNFEKRGVRINKNSLDVKDQPCKIL